MMHHHCLRGSLYSQTHKDNMYEAFFAETNDGEFDTPTIQCLEILMNGLFIIFERLAEDQLPGGKYCNANENIKQSASSIPKTNKVSEHEFALLDLLVRTKPRCMDMSRGALLMWGHNGTPQWLDSRTDQERKELLENWIFHCSIKILREEVYF